MKAQLIDLITETLRQFDGQDGLVVPRALDPDTALFGKDGFLDSTGLVSVVVAVEQTIEDRFGVSLSLADAKAMSQKHSPYRTIASLAEYANGLMQPGG